MTLGSLKTVYSKKTAAAEIDSANIAQNANHSLKNTGIPEPVRVLRNIYRTFPCVRVCVFMYIVYTL